VVRLGIILGAEDVVDDHVAQSEPGLDAPGPRQASPIAFSTACSLVAVEAEITERYAAMSRPAHAAGSDRRAANNTFSAHPSHQATRFIRYRRSRDGTRRRDEMRDWRSHADIALLLPRRCRSCATGYQVSLQVALAFLAASRLALACRVGGGCAGRQASPAWPDWAAIQSIPFPDSPS
jgi:hypothetical protein